MRGREKRRGRAVTGVLGKDGQCCGIRETSVLKPACTLPGGTLQEGFVRKLTAELSRVEA